MRWCLEDHSPYAEKVLDEIIAGEQAYVPALWLYEAISGYGGIGTKRLSHPLKAQGFFEDLRVLDIEVDSATELSHIFGAAHRLAIKYGLTGYDAAYLELALRTGLPLASLDKDLNKAALRAGVTLVQP